MQETSDAFGCKGFLAEAAMALIVLAAYALALCA